MHRVVFLICSSICLSLASCGWSSKAPAQQSSLAPPQHYRIQEGYPIVQLQKLQNRGLSLQSHLGISGAANAQAVILRSEKWTPQEMPITVAFRGGSQALRQQIVDVAQIWTANSGVRFDFGSPGQFREWTQLDTTNAADVRVAFDATGYWSWVGAEGVDSSFAGPGETTLNLEGFDKAPPDDWKAVVLHEFGHAIGFEHEHQSPAADCSSQFRWNDDPGYVSTTDIYGQFVQDSANRQPGIYTVLGGPPNNWTKTQVDNNLRSLPATLDLIYTAFDRQSIMMYSFGPWMYVNGMQSSCYTPENLTTSAVDLYFVASVYPPGPFPLAPTAPSPASDLRGLLKQKKLPPEVKAHLQKRLSVM